MPTTTRARRSTVQKEAVTRALDEAVGFISAQQLHHHLVCERCGRAVEIDPPGEEWIRTAAERHGFTVSHHIVEAFGRCTDCRTA